MKDRVEPNLADVPYSFSVAFPGGRPSHHDNHITRALSSMKGQFHDAAAFEQLLRVKDAVVYEVYETTRGGRVGELAHGVSIVHPGLVGDEFYMTKGHFHTVLDTAEVYMCLEGEGLLVMETLEGDWAVESMSKGRIVYVPPRWGHRSVNIGPRVPLVTAFAYPAHAGHEYGPMEERGMRKIILSIDGQPTVVDNPRWAASRKP